MADAQVLLLLQPAGNLFGTPILSQQFLHQRLLRRADAAFAFRFAFGRQTMRLLRTVPASSLIPFQFAADGRFMDPDHLCDFGPRMSALVQGINPVSLFLGKLAVGSYLCSFDLVV
jgi:hypothetical protein